MYSRGQHDDEKAHKHEHDRILRGIEFRAKLKPSELVKRASSGTVVSMIAPDDARFAAKIREVLEIVNRDLGFIADGDLAPHNHKIFLAIRRGHQNGLSGQCLAGRHDHRHKQEPVCGLRHQSHMDAQG